MPDEQLKLALLDILPESGEGVAAGQAIDTLEKALNRQISLAEFGDAQKQLIEEKKLVRSRRGVQAVLSKKSTIREIDSYRDIERFLHKYFVPDVIDPVPQMVDYVVQITATAGTTTGLWTRPDLALATVTRYRFSAKPDLELYGFEVKKEEGCTVYAVHEALAHAAFVHYASVIVLLPAGSLYRRNLPRMREQAAEHGVGLLTILDIDRSPVNYEVLLEPRRSNPPLWRIDDFIETRFSESAKQKLVSWLGKEA